MRLITISILKLVHGTIYTPWSEWLSAGGQEKCYDTGFEVRSRECKIGKSLKDKIYYVSYVSTELPMYHMVHISVFFMHYRALNLTLMSPSYEI